MPKTDSCPFAGTTTVAHSTDKDAAFSGIRNRHVAQPLLGAGSMLWRKMCKYSVRRYGNFQQLSCGEMARFDLEMCPLSERSRVSGGEVALPTHAAPRPCTSEVSPTEMHHQRVAQDCPGDNVALNIESLDKNYTRDFAPPGRLEQNAGEPFSLPTHTASNPSTEKVLTVEMPHQRPDQASPDDTVASNIKGQDKNNIPETRACWTSGSRCYEVKRRCRLPADTHGVESVHGGSVYGGNASSTS